MHVSQEIYGKSAILQKCMSMVEAYFTIFSNTLFSVQSDETFSCGFCAIAGTCNKECTVYHPFSDYKKFFPSWDILPSDMFDSSAFWMFMFVKYEKDLAEWYAHERPDIPQHWRSITEQKAKDSLRKLKS